MRKKDDNNTGKDKNSRSHRKSLLDEKREFQEQKENKIGQKHP